jgi:hypothetical protein
VAVKGVLTLRKIRVMALLEPQLEMALLEPQLEMALLEPQLEMALLKPQLEMALLEPQLEMGGLTYPHPQQRNLHRPQIIRRNLPRIRGRSRFPWWF